MEGGGGGGGPDFVSLDWAKANISLHIIVEYNKIIIILNFRLNGSDPDLEEFAGNASYIFLISFIIIAVIAILGFIFKNKIISCLDRIREEKDQEEMNTRQTYSSLQVERI